jgi:hypothetical protein
VNQWRSTRMLIGMLTIPLSGVLGSAVLLLRGPLVLPLESSTEWIETVSSSSYLVYQNLLVASYVLPFFGFLALYAYLAGDVRQERLSFIGLIISIWGTALALPALGIVSYVGSLESQLSLADETSIGQIVAEALIGPGFAMGIAAAILYTTGPFLLGVAIWRKGTLPKIATLMFMAHGALLSFGFSMFSALILGWGLFAISGIWLTLSMKNEMTP